MADPLKTFFDAALVRRLAASIERVHPTFAGRAFVRDATRGLDDLELLARGRHLAEALAAHLPPAYPDALAILLRSLGPEHADDELVGAGMAPFFYLPHVIFVAERGLAHFEESMTAQYELTKRFTAEFSIRPYLEHEPERTFAVLARWTEDPNPHVRRLVSEGTRLRLPWATRVRYLDAHPERALALLERLRDDPSTLVRRSVANHLNDLGKVHPELLFATAERWMKGATTERRALLEHALRSAVKRGEPRALALLGFGGKADVTVEGVRIAPARVAIGGEVRVAFSLHNASRRAVDLLVDLGVHFVKARGARSRKVFKLRRVRLEPGAREAFESRVSLAVHTTRTPYPGEHAVEALVNGKALALGTFEVITPGGATKPRKNEKPA